MILVDQVRLMGVSWKGREEGQIGIGTPVSVHAV